MPKTSNAQLGTRVPYDEIKLRLRVLNQIEGMGCFNFGSARCQSMGLTNAKMWFHNHAIEIYRDKRGRWQLVPTCKESQEILKTLPLPTLLQIRGRIQFDIVALAGQANIDPLVIYTMLHDMPVTKTQATKVLDTLSETITRTCTLANTTVVLFEE